jgi:hypothetical protein
MLGFQGGVSIPLVKGGVKAPPAKRQCRAGPKAGARRGFTFGIMRDYFMGKCLKENYEYTDIHEIFVTRHSQDGSRFEFPTDGHWNNLGHELAARAIAFSRVFKSTFPNLNK